MTDLRQQKQVLRGVMKTRRDEAFAANPGAAMQLRHCFQKNIDLLTDVVIGSYMGFGSEMDVGSLTDFLRSLGNTIALPRVPGQGQPLSFHIYNVGDVLAKNTFGVSEPLASATQMVPDLLLVPLLAFDQQRYRLGYGGGFYDRTLSDIRRKKPVQTIGIGYAVQQVPEVPRGAYDVQLDKILTEIQVY